MDLKNLNVVDVANQGEWLELEHPVTGEPLGVRIKLAGIDSDYYKKEMRRQQNRRLKKGIRNISAEELEAETISLLVACTLEWENVEYDGTPLECNAENVRKIYKEFSWIREQVDVFINNRGNFIKN